MESSKFSWGLLPLAPDTAIVFSKRKCEKRILDKNIRRHIAACSVEYFISDELSPDLQELARFIGKAKAVNSPKYKDKVKQGIRDFILCPEKANVLKEFDTLKTADLEKGICDILKNWAEDIAGLAKIQLRQDNPTVTNQT